MWLSVTSNSQIASYSASSLAPIQTGQWSWGGLLIRPCPLSRTRCYSEKAFHVEITLRQHNLSMLTEMWDTDVDERVWVARVRSGGWEASSLPLKTSLIISTWMLPENTPRAPPWNSCCSDPRPLLCGPHCRGGQTQPQGLGFHRPAPHHSGGCWSFPRSQPRWGSSRAPPEPGGG